MQQENRHSDTTDMAAATNSHGTLRVIVGYAGLGILITGAVLSALLFWRVATTLSDPPKIQSLVNSFERIVGGGFTGAATFAVEKPAPRSNSQAATPDSSGDSSADNAPSTAEPEPRSGRQNIETRQIREVLQAIVDVGIHRIIGIICLFTLLGVLIRLSLGLMSTGARIAELGLWSSKYRDHSTT